MKRVVGDAVVVEADVFADGHDRVHCVLSHQPPGDDRWHEVVMEPLVDDRWTAAFPAGGDGGRACGTHRYRVLAWLDPLGTVLDAIHRKREVGADASSDLLVAHRLLADAANRASGPDAAALADAADPEGGGHPDALLRAESADDLVRRFRATLPRDRAATSPTLDVQVERDRAAIGSWYELFPRSWSCDPDRPGTLADVARQLGYVAEMGFDVLYLPPIHPIGHTHRKGRDNQPTAGPDDPGSPWAIGAAAGGHTAVDPALGDVADLERLVAAARREGLEVALDLAFQCSPDHPWVDEHPEWFRHRPDGTIQYAENPPKRYQDIYPLDFESADWWGLWQALLDVVRCWIGRGIRIFRVDNPHTKPFAFWEWLIAEVRATDPDVVFLSEAFTAPKVMHRLAKVGFSQSYTYFTWRVTASELREYFTELAHGDGAEYFRPNAWPTTPDILPFHLQEAPPEAFAVRLALAATLSPSYGIYGPAFELGENEPVRAGREEYRHAEKYEVRRWDRDDPQSLRPLLARLNTARRALPALTELRTLRFHDVDNEQLLCFSKTAPGADPVLVIVNLDPLWTQSGWTTLDTDALGLAPDEPFTVHDHLGEHTYRWVGAHNYVQLDPHEQAAHVFSVRPVDGGDRVGGGTAR